jgi:hypothetical protein
MSARTNEWPINAKLHTQRAILAPQTSVDALKPLSKILSLKPLLSQAATGCVAHAPSGVVNKILTDGRRPN